MKKNWEEDLKIFRNGDPPEVRFWWEYLLDYVEHKRIEDFHAFLYYYEEKLNTITMGYVQRYAMYGHFLDLKMVRVEAIWQAAQQYKPWRETPFLKFKEGVCRYQLDEYIRSTRTGYSVPSAGKYKKLKKVMAIYNANGRKDDPELISYIASEVKISEKMTRELIDAGRRSEGYADKYYGFLIAEGEDVWTEIPRDNRTNPERVYLLRYRERMLKRAFKMLDNQDQDTIAAYNKFCPVCFGNVPKRKKKDMAFEREVDAQTILKQYRSAVRRLRQKLVDIGYFEEDQIEDDLSDTGELENEV